jgi:hypothetical protein
VRANAPSSSQVQKQVPLHSLARRFCHRRVFSYFLSRSLVQDGNYMAKSSVGSVPARATAPRQQQQQHEDDADQEEFFMA